MVTENEYSKDGLNKIKDRHNSKPEFSVRKNNKSSYNVNLLLHSLFANRDFEHPLFFNVGNDIYPSLDIDLVLFTITTRLPLVALVIKNSPSSAGDIRDTGLSPGSG